MQVKDILQKTCATPLTIEARHIITEVKLQKTLFQEINKIMKSKLIFNILTEFNTTDLNMVIFQV